MDLRLICDNLRHLRKTCLSLSPDGGAPQVSQSTQKAPFPGHI